MAENFEAWMKDEENVCEKSPTGKHEPDWKTVHVEYDGDDTYIDVSCIHCGHSGCIGTSKQLAKNISW